MVGGVKSQAAAEAPNVAEAIALCLARDELPPGVILLRKQSLYPLYDKLRLIGPGELRTFVAEFRRRIGGFRRRAGKYDRYARPMRPKRLRESEPVHLAF